MAHKKVLDDKGNTRKDVVFRDEDNAWIPTDVRNRDYQEFLKLNILIDNLDVKQ